MKNIYEDQNYWDNSYNILNLQNVNKNDQLKIWIEQNIKKTENETCIEIGCYPGKYLSILGKRGYELNGIDLFHKVNTDLPIWLKSFNYKIGDFFKEDFRSYKFQKKYDLVCSFGFIEHFYDWKDIIFKHIELVKDHGLLLITSPNFKGIIQHLSHLIFDFKNLKRHNIKAINPEEWKKILEENNFDIIFCDYIGKFELWAEFDKKSKIKKLFFNLFYKAMNLLFQNIINNKTFSPYCCILARKKIV